MIADVTEHWNNFGFKPTEKKILSEFFVFLFWSQVIIIKVFLKRLETATKHQLLDIYVCMKISSGIGVSLSILQSFRSSSYHGLCKSSFIYAFFVVQFSLAHFLGVTNKLSRFACNTRVIVDASSNPALSCVKCCNKNLESNHQVNKQKLLSHHQSVKW